MSVILRSVPFDLPHRDRHEFAVRDRRVTVDGMTPSTWRPGPGHRCCCCTGTSRAPPAGDGSSPPWPAPTGYSRSACPATATPPPPTATTPPAPTWPGSWPRSSTPCTSTRTGPGRTLRRRRARATPGPGRPASVRSLTLVDSAGLGPEVHPLLALDTLPIIGELAIMFSRLPGGDWGARPCPPRCCSPSPGGSPPSSSPNSTPWDADPANSRPPPPWPAPCSSHRATRDPARPPPTLTMPTLVVWGGYDYVLPAHHAQAAVDRLPDGRLAVFPTAGTCPTWSAPTGSPPC